MVAVTEAGFDPGLNRLSGPPPEGSGRAKSAVKSRMCRKMVAAGKRGEHTCAVHAGRVRDEVLTLAGQKPREGGGCGKSAGAMQGITS